MVNWLLVTVALVAAQGGLIYGFDSGMFDDHDHHC